MTEYYSLTTENSEVENADEIYEDGKTRNPCNDYLFSMFQKGKSAEYYMSLLNVKTAKIIALILVLLFGGLYHGILHILYGVTPCKGLLKDGIYKSGSTAFSFRGDFNQGTGLWQPWGCMMHKYTNV